MSLPQPDNERKNPLEELRENPRDSWQEAWSTAVELAVEELRRADMAERCVSCGARWDREEGIAEVDFLYRTYRVSTPDFAVTLAEGEEAPIREKILILHYLQKASGVPLKGEWIAFTQVPGGELYLGNFRARSVDRLVRSFDGREDELAAGAAALGGTPGEFGDVSAVLKVLPKVPVAVVFWRGDDEFPSSGDVLFDATVGDYLPLEDMVVLAEMVVGRLCKQERRSS